MRKEHIQGSTASPPDFSATQTSEGGTSPLRPVFRGKGMAWIFLLVSLAVTFFVWYLARGVALQRAHDRFVFRSQTIESALRERLDSCSFLLQCGAGLFASSEEVTRADWRTYVRALQIDQHYPGVQGLGFAKRILPAEKKAHIRQIREEGFPDYDIQPEGARPEYTPIIFLEPFDWRNQRAFGYDMFSEPTRKEAMVMARDTGSTALSGKVTLLQETEKDVQAGLLMYLPVYRKGEIPETPEQRREALKGYVYSPFRMNDFMQGILIEKREYVELQIFDGDEPRKEALLYPGGIMDVLSHSGHAHFATYQSILEYAGRRWFLVFNSSPYFEETIDTGNVNSILYLGIIISLLLFSAVLSLTKSRNQALALANMSFDLEKTNLNLRSEIAERKQAEDALREKERLLSESQRLGHIGSFLYKITGSIQWSDELYRLYGVSPETFTPTLESFLGLIHPDYRESMQAWISACAAGEKPDALDFRINMPDGTVRFVRGWGDAVYDDENRLTYLAGSVLDITERKKEEEKNREQQALTTKIIETIPLRVFWKDRDLRFLGGNTLFARDAGLTRPEELIGKTDFEMVWKDQAEMYRADDRRVMDTNIPKLSYDEPQTSPEGGQIWLRTSKVPLQNEMKETIGILGVYEDITAYKETEEELQRYAAELEKKNQELQGALAEVKQLTGLLPICASCKRIKDDKGDWSGVETYVSEHTDAVFSHGLCPECERKAHEELENLLRENS